MTDMIPAGFVVPPYLANRTSGNTAILDAMASGGSSGPESGPRISIRAGRFRVVENGTESVLEDRSLRVLIWGTGTNLTKTYYPGAYNPEETSGPDCFSMDGKTPDKSIEVPQADSCATCPMGAWGSSISPTGAKGKACRDSKRMALVPAGDSSGNVYSLSVPPSGLKSLQEYSQTLKRHGIDPTIGVTELYFDPETSFPRLLFKFDGYLPEDRISQVEQQFVAASTANGPIDVALGVLAASLPAPAAVAVAVAETPPPAASPFGKPAAAAAPAAAAPAAPAGGAGSDLAATIEALVSNLTPDDAT